MNSDYFNKEEFENYKQDPTFKGLIKSIEEQDDRFKELSDDDKYLAMYLLVSNKVGAIEGLSEVVYKRKIPTPEEFLTKEYIGQFADLLYPKWKDVFIEAFSEGSRIKELVLTGCIGAGKSTMAMLCHFYNLYRINSLKYPQLVMGSGPNKWMVMQLMSLSLDKAGSTLLDGVKEFLKSCQHYQEIPKKKIFKQLSDQELSDPIVPWVDAGDRIIFPSKVAVRIGSRDEHGIGEDLFSVHMDEIDFKKVQSVDTVFNSYAQLTERIRSRFLGKQFTLSTLVSSITKQTGAMNKYVQNVSEDDKETKVCSYAIWDIKFPGLFEKHGHFYAMRGTKTHPSKIMEDHEQDWIDAGKMEAPPGCKYIKVPGNYRKDFSTNIERALMNLAGVASNVDEKPFDDLSNIEDLFLAPIVEISAPLKSDTPLWKQLPSSLWIKTPEGIRLARCPSAARYMHLDLADTGVAGISMVHKELSKLGGVMYIADFILKVTSPNRISLESIQKFLFDLNELFAINLEKITADQYQSTGMLQSLEKNKIARKVERLSVDRFRTQYDVLSSLISEGLFKCGKEQFLKEQLENIAISNNKPYVTPGMRKDVADTICGSVYNAHSNPADQPVYYWQDLSKPKVLEEDIPEGFKEL